MLTFAQISQNDDLIFRIVLIPGGLFLIWIGLRAMRLKQIHLRKRRRAVQGAPAVVLGAIVTLAGIGCTLAAVGSFLPHRPLSSSTE